MGSLILCHKCKAKHPYEISSIHRKIYTIEELCYYLCNNIYLIDYTIMNEPLCHWLEEELELFELAEKLRTSIEAQDSMEHLVMLVLKSSAIYTPAEIMKMQSVLERFRNQKDVERQKYKADNLLESGECELAILVYQAILNDEKDETVGDRFYARIYACLGSAYGRLFLYEEAANMYEQAFKQCSDEKMLLPYLYSCYRYLPAREYKELVDGSEVYRAIDVKIQEKIQEQRKKMSEKAE